MRKRRAVRQLVAGAMATALGLGTGAGYARSGQRSAATSGTGGWCAIDPGFCLPTPDADAINAGFRRPLGDPDRIDPGFLIPPPDRPTH